MISFERYASNEVARGSYTQFAAILGVQPSKGARSPKLWNAAFAARGIDARMIAIDLQPEHLRPMLAALQADPTFLGGAIAAPYKEQTAEWLNDRLTAPAKAVGAVNCLFRDECGQLCGTNTDGEGALASCVDAFGPVGEREVLLLGAGGAGKAVAAYFATAVAHGKLIIATRSPVGGEYAARLGARWLEWGAIAARLPRTELLVNCTSVGWGAQADQSPLGAGELARLPPQAAVFDIIYQPRPSRLLQLATARGLRTLDGLAMNLEQAVLAFARAVPGAADAAGIRRIMQTAANQV